MIVVLDASGLVDILLGTAESTWVLDSISGHQLCAPAHQPVEVVPALARLHRAGVLDRDALDGELDEMVTLEQEHLPPTAAHVHRAVQLADRLRVLDGLYVALAEERRFPLVTTDRHLGRSGAPCDLRMPD